MNARPAGVTILIADDDAQIRHVVVRRLRELGYTVLEASDGAAALQVATEKHPAVVILDVMMPEKNGWEVARALKTSEATADIKVLMLSAIGPRVNEATSMVYGADDYLDKPFEFLDLEDKIAALVAEIDS